MKISTLSYVAFVVVLAASVNASPVTSFDAPPQEHHPFVEAKDSDAAKAVYLMNNTGGNSLPQDKNPASQDEAQLQYDLNSIIAGFRGPPEIGNGGNGFETSAFGGLVTDLIEGNKTKEKAQQEQNKTSGFDLMSLLRSLGAPKKDADAKGAIGNLDMFHLLKGFGLSSSSFPVLLAAFGVKRDQNAPGGSAPEGGSYDLTKLMASVNQKVGQDAGVGSNLGFLGGSLGFLVGNAEKGGGNSGGLSGIIASVIGG